MTHQYARAKKKLLEQLEKAPIIDYACQKVGISRSTYYRWITDDAEFKQNALAAEERGRLSINDVAESKLIQKVNDADMRAITYWLESNHKRYIKPRQPVQAIIQPEKTEPLVVKIVGANDVVYESLEDYQAAHRKEDRRTSYN